MPVSLKRALAIASIAMLAGAPVRAQGRPPTRVPDRPRVGIEAYGSWSRYAMEALNDSLQSLNRQIGTRFTAIHDGPAWGLGFRIWPNPLFLLRLGFERLEASNEDSGVRFDVSTHVYSASGTFFFSNQHRLRYGLGLGACGYYPSGGIEANTKLPSGGDGFGGSATVEALLPASTNWSVDGVLGYRWGVVRNLQFGATASDLDIDYAGVFVRVGLALEAPSRAGTSSP